MGSHDYWQERKIEPDARHDYWLPAVTDPDGKIRNRLDDPNEEQQYVEDLHDEIAFADSYVTGAILDVGCGPGWLLSALKGKWIKYGIEPSIAARENARKRGIVIRDAIQYFASESVDFAICYHVIEHLPNPFHVVVDIYRVLRKGGGFLLGTPDFGCPCAKRFGPNYRMLHDPTHRSLFTLESATRMVRDAGFQVLDTTFPFPARYATAETFCRWNDTARTSPPWPGNWFTLYCCKP